MTKSVKRLSTELKEMIATPPPLADARPDENNLLRWVFVLDGAPDTPFVGGEYIGELTFPDTYPFKPPSIKMTTPSGRFRTGTRLCFSMSDFHPEEWSPMWGVRQILIGMNSFMSENASTHGSITTTDKVKRELAQESHAFNTNNVEYRKLFPERYARALQKVQDQAEEKEAQAAAARQRGTAIGSSADVDVFARFRRFLATWSGIATASGVGLAVFVVMQSGWLASNVALPTFGSL